MTDGLKRRTFFADPTPAPMPVAPADEALLATAARNGFTAPPAPAPEPTSASLQALARPVAGRRERPRTGRDHHFTTRLRAETLDYIYAQANGRNIPVAQVIEEMEAAHRRAHQS